MKSIGFLNSSQHSGLKRWLSTLTLGQVVKSSYASKRKERWFRMGSNLQNPKSGGRIFDCDEAPEYVNLLGNSLLIGWHSILVCGGDTSIDWHRDHGHFEAKAVMLNFGEAVFMERLSENHATQLYALRDGEIVEIDTKVLHKAQPTSPHRMNLTFRKIKPEYLQVRSLFD